MGSDPILVVCTGNVCRSPAAEALLRRELVRRFGPDAPVVSSAGTMGWEGSPATAESIAACRELGVDITGHRGRRLTPEIVADAGLIVTMAREHTEAVTYLDPAAAPRTFTLKELARLLEEGETGGDPATRIAAAAVRRAAGSTPPGDLDVADPLGEPLAVYRAMAAELEDWSRRLVAGLAPSFAAEEPAP